VTKHSVDCNMAFGRKDPSCPRCQELMAGAAPRAGWQKSYYANKTAQEAAQRSAIRHHDCKVSGCSVVCTFGDW
jgi:hypothetical protein